MNLIQARASLRKKIGNPTIDNVPDADLTALLNTAQSFITARYAFNETRKLVSFNTVIGQDRYTVPTDMLAIRRIWDNTNKKKLLRRGIRFLSMLPLTGFDPGAGRFYVHDSDWIQILPQADAVASIYLSYIAQPPVLVADGDKPIFPESWHDGWVLKARHIYYDEKGDTGKAIYARIEWKDWVADKPSEIDFEKDDMDDVGIELPELSQYSRASIDPRYDPYFDTRD